MSLTTENYLYFQSIEGTRNPAKRLMFKTEYNVLEELKKIESTGITKDNNILYINTESDEMKTISGKYNLTFNIVESNAKNNLYNFENVELQTINGTVLKILLNIQ